MRRRNTRNTRNTRTKTPSDQRFGSECAVPFHTTDHCSDRAVALVARGLIDFKPGEIVDLSYGKNTARFLVSWVGTVGTPQEGHVGLRSLRSGAYLWDVEVSRIDVGRRTLGTPSLRLIPPQN